MNLTTTPLTKKCEWCKEFFCKRTNITRTIWKTRKYCSLNCSNDSLKGKPSWNRGKKGLQVSWCKGKTGWMSERGRKNLAESARRNIAKETSEQRKLRIQHSVETKKRIGGFKGTLGRIKELSAVWLGDKATYNAKHRWIQKNWQKTGICQKCGAKPKPYGGRKWGTEWANLDGVYNREDKSTWLELCKKCHRKLGVL